MINVKLNGNDSSVIELQMHDDAIASRNILKMHGRYFVFSGIAGGSVIFTEGAEVLDISNIMTPGSIVIAPSIQVASGHLIPFESPPVEWIEFRDIAHSLSKLCRYNGHTVDFYSVAEHSVLIYRWLRAQGASLADQRAGLIHDAPEYLVGDMTKPLKGVIGEPFSRIEFSVWEAICKKYGVSLELPQIVKEADLRILFNEKSQVFMRKVDWGWEMEPLPGVEVKFWGWRRAFDEFMECAMECGLISELEYLA